VNPVQHLLAASGALSSLPAASRQILTGRKFFPELISGPFQHGLAVVFAVAAALAVLAGVASLLRGGRDLHAAAAGVPREGSAGPREGSAAPRAHSAGQPEPPQPGAAPPEPPEPQNLGSAARRMR
jgi:hypothetical protein